MEIEISNGKNREIKEKSLSRTSRISNRNFKSNEWIEKKQQKNEEPMNRDPFGKSKNQRTRKF